MKRQNTKDVKIAVIGAGCSGITAVKNLLQVGLQKVVCYEQNDQVGGNWVYSPKLTHSSVCETTHIISSKTLSEYLDYPMPADYPDYPSHAQLLRYFHSYVEHFGLLPYIRFNTKVAKIEKIEGEKWRIKTNEGEEVFDYVLVANGHHSVPRMPTLEGEFAGHLQHSHAYKHSLPFQGQRVLVIGVGNSGCDCAVEISRAADFVAISQRSPQYIVPKFFMGKPTDVYNTLSLYMPTFLSNWFQKLALLLQIGAYKNYNLLTPKHKVTAAHPTVNSELLYKIKHGKVHPRVGIEKIEGHQVHFKDGKVDTFDTIVAATGYKITFPFFDTNFIDYSEAERVPLYLRMFHPQHSSLIFIGLFQPMGAIWPASDAQAKLAANYITGNWTMPKNVATLAERDADHITNAFLKSKRHTIEVDYHAFMHALLKQLPKNAPEWQVKQLECL